MTVDVRFTDAGAFYRLQLANGVLTYSPVEKPDAADATLRLPFPSLALLASGTTDPAALDAAGIEITGDASVLGRVFAVLDDPDPDFAIVTPELD